MQQVCMQWTPELDLTSTVSNWIHVVSKNVEKFDQKISELIRKIWFSVNMNMPWGSPEQSLYTIQPNFQGIDMPEKRIREILMDNHWTFPVFVQSMNYACEEVKKSGRKVSVNLYIDDLGKDDFSRVLEDAKSQGINPDLILLNIHSDDHGILDSKAINNLKTLQKLGFQFSIHDFELNNNEIDFTNTVRLIEWKVLPNLIFIAQNVIDAIRSGVAIWYVAAARILSWLKHVGIGIIQKESEEKLYSATKIDDIQLVNDATISEEKILWSNGTVRATELLVRFKSGITVPQWLDTLKNEWNTISLLKKVADHAISWVKLWYKTTINTYMRDLSDPRFQLIIQEALDISPEMRKNLVFEILEYRYGTINKQAIRNIKALKQYGFSIAVDDLYIGNNPDSMSKEILETLIEEGISPDFIKLDGSHMEDLKEWKLDSILLDNMKQLISYFSIQKNKPILIAEWVKNSEHGKYIQDIFWSCGLDIWYQWRDINPENFCIQ